MIILTNTTDKIRVKLGSVVSTTELKCYIAYRDTTSTTITPNRNVTNTNGTTEVDLVSSPPSSTQRIIDYLSVYNADTSSAIVTIEFYDNGTIYDLSIVTLGVGEKVEYQEGIGFKIISTNGAIKVAENEPGLTESSLIKFVSISGDVTSTSTSFADITDLSFPVVTDKTYWFRFVIPYTVGTTATGIRLSINGPSSPTYLVYYVELTNGASVTGIRLGLTTYDVTPTSTNSSTTNSNIGIIEGLITPSSNGTLIGRFGIESAGQTTTIKSGAMIKYLEI
jgi:hypothetical protein